MRILKSPFDMQNILSADEHLYKIWKTHPFILDLDYEGKIMIKLVDPDNDGEYIDI